MRRLFLACVAAAAGFGSGCASPTTPATPDYGVMIESFTTTLAVGGKRFYSFSIPHAGGVSLTLLSTQVSGQPSDVAIGIGLGVPAGTDCNVSVSAVTAQGITAQVKANLPVGLYCAAAYDVGNLTATLNFAVNIIHPR